MAAVLHPLDPWIENTFLHAITFQSRANEDEASQASQEMSHEESQWEQTENTIPSGLLPSQQPIDNIVVPFIEVPSRQSKIVQIVKRGGSGWDGSTVDSDDDSCPPYVILHDGQHSTVAFLDRRAQVDIGMNVTTPKSTDYEPDACTRSEQTVTRSKRITAQRITLRDKCLASIHHYTLSTITTCCRNLEHVSNVLGALNISDNRESKLKPLRRYMLCLYVQGITVFGGENQGLIGETADVHVSPNIIRVLREFNIIDDERDRGGMNGYNKLMERLERVHIYYENEMKKKFSRDNEITVKKDSFVSDWPWESRVTKLSSAGREGVEQGNVVTLLNDNDELHQVLEGLENEDENSKDEDEMEDDQIIGRASTGTVLTRWDINDISENENGILLTAASQKCTLAKCDSAIDASEKVQGNAEELLNNYEHFEDILEFAQESANTANDNPYVEANKPVTPSRNPRERSDIQSPGNVVPFIGIDQMFQNSEESGDDESEWSEHQPLTQAETVLNGTAIHVDLKELTETTSKDMAAMDANEHTDSIEQVSSEPDADDKESEENNNTHPNSQEFPLTFSQTLNPEQSSTGDQDVDEDVAESQFPTCVVPTGKYTPQRSDKSRDKRLRYSQIPMQSQVPIDLRKQPEYDSDNSDAWLKVCKVKSKSKLASQQTFAGQSESQVAREGSEEIFPPNVCDTALFDNDQKEVVDSEEEEEELQQHEETEKVEEDEERPQQHEKHDSHQHDRLDINDVSVVATSEPRLGSKSRRTVRDVDMDRFLMRAKRLCKR